MLASFSQNWKKFWPPRKEKEFKDSCFLLRNTTTRKILKVCLKKHKLYSDSLLRGDLTIKATFWVLHRSRITTTKLMSIKIMTNKLSKSKKVGELWKLIEKYPSKTVWCYFKMTLDLRDKLNKGIVVWQHDKQKLWCNSIQISNRLIIVCDVNMRTKLNIWRSLFTNCPKLRFWRTTWRNS